MDVDRVDCNRHAAHLLLHAVDGLDGSCIEDKVGEDARLVLDDEVDQIVEVLLLGDGLHGVSIGAANERGSKAHAQVGAGHHVHLVESAHFTEEGKEILAQ